MDQLKWTTPIKNENKCDNLMLKSPVLYKTPVKECETSLKHTSYPNSMSCFTVLPCHITPPSGLTKFIARNPFESDLTNRLHLSVISPTVFNKVSRSSQQPPEFEWSVDELALIQPAKIEEFPMQQIHCVDPETETKAQAAIDRFFKENQIIPSPWEMKRKDNLINMKVETPKRSLSDLKLESSKLKKDGWSQTVLSLPPELPLDVAEALKPYFTFTQEQNIESDDANSSNNSLRRKLFFNHDDCMQNEEETSVYLSPVKMNGSLMSSSPPQSGMLVHGSPLKHSENVNTQHNMSQITTENLSSPNISPILNTVNNISCESTRLKSRSVARLDFTTEMSLDKSSLHHKEYSNNHSLDKSLNKFNEQVAENKTDNSVHIDSNSTCIQASYFTEAKVVSKSATHSEHELKTEASEFNVKRHNPANVFKQLTDSCKLYTNESCILQQTNTILGISDQQSISNSVQDTGYQTYSMSNTTNVTDSYNSTPVKQKACWRDQILLIDDEFRMSDWKENVKNIYSSTPSKTNKEWDNYIH
ncbi:aurora kinase A activator-like protein bora [Ptiloglossa arizonensis]|uniref:aurora kinase A activator-like protein bora n=1 Tax=Ptiloglossa arizonensis TaxID=3350558 RepID=UPI003F9FBC78